MRSAFYDVMGEQIREDAMTKQSKGISFKPNKNLGEAPSSKDVMKYRQDLLNTVKNYLYKKAKPVLDSDKTDDEKVTEIDKIVDDYIAKAQKVAADKIEETYTNGAVVANKKLRKLGAKNAIIPANTPRLQCIVQLQKESIEDRALIVRGRLRLAIRLKTWYGYYGRKK
ncbi:MAG: hypothetical protein K8E24_014805 [Methanobacterium paludis]|nr:hypothetical protein [Methanobacterium paludis]